VAEPDDSLSLVLPFDTTDPKFRRGVEVGVLWATLRLRGRAGGTVCWETAAMLMKIADEKRLQFSAKPVDETWVTVSIRRGASSG
jgi:hypothetical protein